MSDGGLDKVLRVSGRTAAGTIPVRISYEIIRLFSEGLYQSPQKAIEELVSNGYDASAKGVHVLLPEESDGGKTLRPLWVIDDGNGMDTHGFHQLWRVAKSEKADVNPASVDRPPIGQFGIGKLASYVLARQLLHVSKVDSKIRCTSMNFRLLDGIHQYDEHKAFEVTLYELTAKQAKSLLGDIRQRSPEAWNLLFETRLAAKSWTVAGLSDFKDLYDRLSAPRLRWVLSTGLPRSSNFSIWLNGEELKSSKESYEQIAHYTVGASDGGAAASLGFKTAKDGIYIDGIDGKVAGQAVIYARRLTEGKSDQYGRSHGFFIRVRGRVINLEDELFGLDALNHAAWSRFYMEVDADGLRDHLLSSREGVRESKAVDQLRKYLHAVFNQCRHAFEDREAKNQDGLDIESLLRDAPSLFVTEPIFENVRTMLAQQQESFYFSLPEVTGKEPVAKWLKQFEHELTKSPFRKVLYENTGVYDRALHFVPETQTLIMNRDHPFVQKLLAGSKNRAPATLFGSAEVLMDALLQEQGLGTAAALDILNARDRLLRLIAGDLPSTAEEVLRLLSVANRNDRALERATGAAFRVLGFEYERRGGYEDGPDGILYARLGRVSTSLADYKVVYDTKQTNEPSVPADKVDPTSIEEFRVSEKADYSLFLADAYQAENSEAGKLNRKVAIAAKNGQPITLLRIADLRLLVELHYRYGVTLARLRGLFEDAHTVPDVKKWIEELRIELQELEPQVPLKRLLESLEDAKVDDKARPNVNAVRAVTEELKPFTPERLAAALNAVEVIVGKRWIEIDRGSGNVILHHSASQIVLEVERHIGTLFGGSQENNGEEKC